MNGKTHGCDGMRRAERSSSMARAWMTCLGFKEMWVGRWVVKACLCH